MTVLTPLPSTLGGIGLVLIGVLVAANGLRAGSGPLLQRAIPMANHGGWRAVLLGVFSGLTPPTRLSSTAVVGMAGSGILVTPSALSVGLGAGIGTLACTFFCALAAVRPAFFYVCLIALGCAALVGQAVPFRAAKGGAHMVVGWAVFGIGLHLFAQGVTGLVDATPSTIGQVAFGWGLVAFTAGILSGAYFGGGVVIAVAMGTAAAGVLEPVCATAAILGTHAAGPLGALITQRMRGTTRRITTGLLIIPSLQSGLGFLALSVFPGALRFAGSDPQGTMVGIAAFIGGFWLVTTILGVLFQAALSTRLEAWIDADDGDSVDALVLPVIAWTAAEARDARCTARAVGLARKIFMGGAEEEEVGFERAAVHQLAFELESILESDAADRRAISAGTRRPRASTALLLRDMVDELSLAHMEAGAQDPCLDASVSSRLRHLSITLLGLIESGMSLSGGDRIPELSSGLARLEAECVEVEHWSVQMASSQLDPNLATALVWRLARLRTLGRMALKIAESRDVWESSTDRGHAKGHAGGRMRWLPFLRRRETETKRAA